MNTNPYKSPDISTERSLKRPYTRFRLFLDVFAIIAAASPLGLRIVVTLVNLPEIESLAFFIILFSSIALGWVASLVINAAGTFRIRLVSIFGLLLNVVSLLAMFVPDPEFL